MARGPAIRGDLQAELALEHAGFEDVRIEVLEHEGGIAVARKPSSAQGAGAPRSYPLSRAA